MISRNISTIRRRWQLSQAELAEMLHCTRDQICNWERGRASPRLEFCQRIAAQAGVSLDQLLNTELAAGSISARPAEGALNANPLQQEFAALHARLDVLEQLLRKLTG